MSLLRKKLAKFISLLKVRCDTRKREKEKIVNWVKVKKGRKKERKKKERKKERKFNMVTV